GPEPDTAASNCCCDTGRATIEATDNTGKPSTSASSTDTDVGVPPACGGGPDGAIRARTDDAPAACKVTPCQENGRAISATSAVSNLIGAACRAAASST